MAAEVRRDGVLQGCPAGWPERLRRRLGGGGAARQAGRQATRTLAPAGTSPPSSPCLPRCLSPSFAASLRPPVPRRLSHRPSTSSPTGWVFRPRLPSCCLHASSIHPSVRPPMPSRPSALSGSQQVPLLLLTYYPGRGGGESASSCPLARRRRQPPFPSPPPRHWQLISCWGSFSPPPRPAPPPAGPSPNPAFLGM